MTSKCAVLLIILLVELVPHVEAQFKGTPKVGELTPAERQWKARGVLWDRTDAPSPILASKSMSSKLLL